MSERERERRQLPKQKTIETSDPRQQQQVGSIGWQEWRGGGADSVAIILKRAEKREPAAKVE